MRHRHDRYRSSRFYSYDWFDDRYHYPNPVAPKPYGLLGLLGDIFMIMFTGGLWFIWIFVREMRRR